MRKLALSIATILLVTLFSLGASAQCTGGLIDNCPAATSPQGSDLVLGWQSGQSPHTRAFTLTEVVAGGLQSQLTVEIKALPSSSSTAGLNLGVGTAPTACVSGDIWSTGAGLFSCVNGAAIGPYGTGGSQFPNYATSAALPAVTSANAGLHAFVLNCPNGSQVGAGATGCDYVVNNVGTWTALPNPTSSAITVGGQVLYPGGLTTNQGNGSKIQLATGSFTVGHALAYDGNGNAVDSGVPPGGGSGGSGTVTASPQNAIPFYSSAGSSTVVSGLTIVNNGVLVTNGSGVPSEATTLPAALTIPNAALTSPTLSGAISIAAASYTGKQTFLTSTAGSASINIPAGVAPTSPVNGDVWVTSAGFFGRANGVTEGPYLFSIVTTGPLTGGGVGPALTLACNTCATTANGGALAATAPLTISAGGLIALGLQPQSLIFLADSTTTIHNDTYNMIEKWPFTGTGTINSIVYHTGGTSTPSFVASLQINGTNIVGCNGLSVTSAIDTTATCTSANVISNGQTLALVISATAGSPTSSVVQINLSKPAS